MRIPRPIPLSGTERVQPGLLKVLLIADPTESLPQAAQEAEQLCKLLDGIAAGKVTLIGGKLVSKAELLTELQAHDVVHFAGHRHYDSVHPSRSGWHSHGGVLTAGELRNLSRPPLLVFSNSCQAGATAAWGGRYRYDEQAFGIGSAFLVSGVRNYIGTFWVVHDDESRDFAVALYFTGGEEFGGRNDFLGRSHNGITLQSFKVNPGGYAGFFNPATGQYGNFFMRADNEAARRLDINQRAREARRLIRYQRPFARGKESPKF